MRELVRRIARGLPQRPGFISMGRGERADRMATLLAETSIVTVDVGGVSFPIEAVHGEPAETIRSTGRYKPATTAAVLDHVDADTEVVVGGASFGYLPVLVHRSASPPRVVGIEPHGARREAFVRNNDKLAGGSIEVSPVLLGSADREAVTADLVVGSASLGDPPETLSVTAEQRTIDSLVDERGLDPGLVVLTVGGAEPAVLDGAERTVREAEATWVVEVHPSATGGHDGGDGAVGARFEAAGYDTRWAPIDSAEAWTAGPVDAVDRPRVVVARP